MLPSQAFVAWVERQLNELPPGGALPPDSALAARWHLSAVTVRRILRRYRDAGRIERIPGKGTFVPGRKAGPEAEPSGTVVDDLVRQFSESVSRGGFKNGEPLPPVKTVALQYRVSTASVTAAYRRLCAEGYAHRTGRRYWAGRFMPAGGTGTEKPVFVFYDGLNSMDVIRKRSGEYYAHSKMERELLRYGYHLSYQPLEAFRRLGREWARGHDYPAGAVYVVQDRKNFEPFRRAVESVAAFTGGRTALLVVCQDTVPRPSGAEVMLIRQHAQTQVCRELARFLLGKGRTRTTVFFDDTQWQPISINGCVKLRSEGERIDPCFSTTFAVIPRSSCGSVDDLFERVLLKPGRSHTEAVLNKYRPVALREVKRDFQLVGAFGEAYRRFRGSDAWVFLRDADADAARELMRKDGTPGPLVVSLENDPRFLHRSITTCTPDWDTIGYVMAHAVIRDIPVPRTSKGYLRTAAIIRDHA